MKKHVVFLMGLFALVCLGLGQKVIENPKKPINKNAGRVIPLEAVLSIEDMGEDYYFRTPRNIKISPDGFIFIQDREQLLQFNNQGEYIRNFLKKGKGPGEVEAVRNFCFYDGNLIVHDVRLNKILWFDMKGELTKEFRILEPIGFANFVKYSDELYYYFKSSIPRVKGKPRVVDHPRNLVVYSQKKKKLRELSSFPIKSFVAVSGGGAMGSIPINRLIAVPYKNFLFISHTPEYSIKVYDLKKEQAVRTITREYKRQQTPPEVKGKLGGMLILNGKKYTRPPQKYLDDIKNLLVYDDKLWVVTSTIDSKKGVLMDVVDLEGNYLDNFYLKFPVIKTDDMHDVFYKFYSMELSKGAVYVAEQNEDGTNRIVKYAMVYQ
ncbi:MAG: 6-bladed beta-propeller [Acidobacteriota bacterium]